MRRLLAFLLLLAAPAVAQTQTTVVVPFAPGGPSDVIGRTVAEGMARALGSPVVVENVSGAGGTIGAARVAQGRADGTLLLLGNIGVATAPSLYRNLPFDPLRDLEPVGLITPVPMVVLGRPDLPASNLAELIAWLQRPGTAATIAHSGVGSASHLCALLLRSLTRAPITTVSFRGTAPAMADIFAGRIDLICDQTSVAAPLVRERRVRGLAVTAADRSPTLPDVPTTAEGGLPELTLAVWHGLYAARGTPAAVTERLAEALRAALAEPAMAQRFATLGGTVEPPTRVTPAAHRAFLAEEVARWRPVIEAAGEFAD
ncbi:MAG: tripartite tricarboxylate transporter substrate-binding protein [Rubritepida sp.]|nr:tripartite tricarboxylate transporter substrate-binding protein [Rubritepida sp.]